MKLSVKMKIGIIIVFLIAFFLIINLLDFSIAFRNFFYSVSAPVQRTFWGAGNNVSNFFEAIFRAQHLKKENEKLELKIEELSAEIAALKEIEKENKVLREALAIGLPEEFKIIFADISGKDIAQDSIVLNKGLKDGVLEGMTIITEQKTFIGRVSKVYDNFSRVMLVSNKNNIIPVDIQKQAEEGFVKAVVAGVGNFQIKLNYIPIEAQIKDGDRVVTSALGGFLPSGILVGYVQNIERLGVELFQKAEVYLAIDLREIEHVFIITDF